MKKRFPVAGGATEYREPRHYRIRHCEGNTAAWCLILLGPDGQEIDSHGGYTTSTCLDHLLKHAGHLKPFPGDSIDLVI